MAYKTPNPEHPETVANALKRMADTVQVLLQDMPGCFPCVRITYRSKEGEPFQLVCGIEPVEDEDK